MEPKEVREWITQLSRGKPQVPNTWRVATWSSNKVTVKTLGFIPSEMWNPWTIEQTEVMPYGLYSESMSRLLCAEQNLGSRVGVVMKLHNNPDPQEKVVISKDRAVKRESWLCWKDSEWGVKLLSLGCLVSNEGNLWFGCLNIYFVCLFTSSFIIKWK